jgi:Protein of unknown function (DUF4230)
MWTARRTICLTVIAVGAAWWLGRRGPSVDHLDTPGILTQVRKLNQLASVKYTVQKVVGIREQKQPVGSESILLILQASVEAGIDLAELRPEHVSVGSDGTAVIRLPPAQILHVFVDEKATKVWDRQKTWWTPWIPYSLDLEQRARLAGLDAVKQEALGMGILGHAERNAVTSIRVLLGLAGVKKIVLVPSSAS